MLSADALLGAPLLPRWHVCDACCVRVCVQRLGCMKGGFREVRAHPWFIGFDWDVRPLSCFALSSGLCAGMRRMLCGCPIPQALMAMKLPPPIIPKFTSPTDLSLFDELSEASIGKIVPFL